MLLIFSCEFYYMFIMMRFFLSLLLYFICKLKILYLSIEYMLIVIVGKLKNLKIKKNIVGEFFLKYVSKIYV